MTTLTRWTPTRDLLNIAEDMNRLVSSIFGDGGMREASLFQGTWSPAVDISEDNDNYYVAVELPGLSKEDIKVRFEDGFLTVSGERKSQHERKDVNFHRVERSYGRFERSFRVPAQILADKIDAHFDKGVLTITLPKAEEAKAKEIEVKIN